MKILSNKKNNGIIYGLFGAAFWGIDTVLIAYSGNGIVSTNSLIVPLIIAFLHDLFSCIWIFLIRIFKNKGFRVKKYKLKSIGFLSVASILGAPIGMTSYVLSIFYLTSNLTSVISSIYPMISAILAILLLHERISKRGIFGIIISVISIAILGVSGVADNVENLSIGLLFCLICILGWGSESVLSSIGMSNDIIPIDALQIRQLTSVLVYIFIIFPIMKVNIFSDIIVANVPLIAIVAMFGTLSYIFYYTSIMKIGATIATSINISYSIWASMLFSLITKKFSLLFILSAMLIIIGNYFVIKGIESVSNGEN